MALLLDGRDGAWWRHWWRTLDQNPIYRREKGLLGKPNPFFDRLQRLSPFFILGALVLGVCTAVNNATVSVVNGGIAALFCLPSIGVGALTIYGMVMAPALTAPAICQERVNGSWEVLQLIPQPHLSILLAKFLGAMGRLRIWTSLAVLSGFQVLLALGSFWVTRVVSDNTTFLSGVAALVAAVRPLVDVFFAGVIGLFFSTLVRSTTVALTSSYATIFLWKLFNNVWLFLFLLSYFKLGQANTVAWATLLPACVNLTAIVAIMAIVIKRGSQLG